MPRSTRRSAARAPLALVAFASLVTLCAAPSCGSTPALPDLVGAPCTDACVSGLICYKGLCYVPSQGIELLCASDLDCTGGTTCDVDAGFCLEGGQSCKATVDCPLDQTCVHGVCFLGYSGVGGGGA